MVGVLEQNIFYVNQVMEFGKFFAVLQQNRTDSTKTIVTAYYGACDQEQSLGSKEAI